MNKIGKISSMATCVILFAAIVFAIFPHIAVYYINGDPIQGEFPYLICYIVPFMTFAFCAVVQSMTGKFRLFAAIKCVLTLVAVIVTFCFMHDGFNIYFDEEPFLLILQISVVVVDTALEMVFPPPTKKERRLAEKIARIACCVLVLAFIGFTPLISYNAYKSAEAEYWDTHYTLTYEFLSRAVNGEYKYIQNSDSYENIRYACVTSSIETLREKINGEEDFFGEGKTAPRSEVAEKYEESNLRFIRRSGVDVKVERKTIVFSVFDTFELYLCVCPEENMAVFISDGTYVGKEAYPEYIYMSMNCSAFAVYA